MPPPLKDESSNETNSIFQQEGSAHFQTGSAFFRSSSRTGRDLGILAAISHKTQIEPKPLRILDAMTGCGVRPLRYALEAKADYIWANEGNTDLATTLQANLSSLPTERYRITHQDANTAFFESHQRQDFYDLIDIDSFGSPMPTLTTALWAIKLGGLLYLTSTRRSRDQRPCARQKPANLRCLRPFASSRARASPETAHWHSRSAGRRQRTSCLPRFRLLQRGS